MKEILDLTSRELIELIIRMNNRLKDEQNFNIKLHGFDVKKEMKQLNITNDVKDAIQGRLNDKLNL